MPVILWPIFGIFGLLGAGYVWMAGLFLKDAVARYRARSAEAQRIEREEVDRQTAELERELLGVDPVAWAYAEADRRIAAEPKRRWVPPYNPNMSAIRGIESGQSRRSLNMPEPLDIPGLANTDSKSTFRETTVTTTGPCECEMCTQRRRTALKVPTPPISPDFGPAFPSVGAVALGAARRIRAAAGILPLWLWLWIISTVICGIVGAHL